MTNKVKNPNKKREHIVFANIANLIKKCLDDNIFDKTASVSFYILTTFFPFVVLLFIIASSISLQMEDVLYSYLKLLPEDTSNIIIDMLSNVSESKGLLVTALAMSMWTMSSAMISLTRAFNCFYSIVETRSPILMRLKCMVYAILVIISIISSFILIIFGGVIGAVIGKYITNVDSRSIWNVARFAFIIVAVSTVFAFLFKVMPNSKIKLRNVLFGSMVTTVSWIGASFAFSFYINNFSKYHIIYGSIAGVLILISWIYITSFVILIGGEINSVYEKAKNTLIKYAVNTRNMW